AGTSNVSMPTSGSPGWIGTLENSFTDPTHGVITALPSVPEIFCASAPCHMNPPPVIGAAIVSGWSTASARSAITTNTPFSGSMSGDPLSYRTPIGVTFSLLPLVPLTVAGCPHCSRTGLAGCSAVGANASAGSSRWSAHAPVSSAPASTAMTAIIFFMRSSSLGGGVPPLRPAGLAGLQGRGRTRLGGLVPLVAARPIQRCAGHYGDDRDHLFHEFFFSGGFAAGDGRWTPRPPPLVYFCHHPA